MTEWTEKYRPRRLEHMVLPAQLRAILHQAAKSGDVPNMLLYGPAGTGKTTAARVLIRRYFFPPTTTTSKDGVVDDVAASDAAAVAATMMVGRSPLDLDVLTLNASDDRSLDMVRLQLRQFMKLAPCPGNPRGMRFVVLDEFDAMTKPAQLALKMLIRDQHCSGTDGVRFILICNYLSRIDPTLREELVCLRFNALPPAAVDAFLRHVMAAEGGGRCVLGDGQLAELRAQHGGSDLRAMLHSLQAVYGDMGGGDMDGTDDAKPLLAAAPATPTEEVHRHLRAHVAATTPTTADQWTDRHRRAAILLFQATDHPERTVGANVRRRALNHLLGGGGGFVTEK